MLSGFWMRFSEISHMYFHCFHQIMKIHRRKWNLKLPLGISRLHLRFEGKKTAVSKWVQKHVTNIFIGRFCFFDVFNQEKKGWIRLISIFFLLLQVCDKNHFWCYPISLRQSFICGCKMLFGAKGTRKLFCWITLVCTV